MFTTQREFKGKVTRKSHASLAGAAKYFSESAIDVGIVTVNRVSVVIPHEIQVDLLDGTITSDSEAAQRILDGWEVTGAERDCLIAIASA